MPQITDLSERDPKKDRTLNSGVNNDTVGTKPISSDPTVNAKAAKNDAEVHQSNTASTGATASSGLPSGTAIAKPDAMSANLDAPAPASTAAASPYQTTDATGTTTAEKISNTAAMTSPGTAETVRAAPVVPTTSAVPPSTPAKGTASGTTAMAVSPTPTAASTPAAKIVQKETTDGSDVRKRKSSFFHKVRLWCYPQSSS